VSVEEFGRMVEGGAFPSGTRLELILGELVDMSPIGVGHGFVVRCLQLELTEQLQRRAVVSTQSSLQCGEWSMPEPDLAVVRGPGVRYRHRHPSAADTLLVIEVAESSLRVDESVKVPLYASAGVPEVWLVDIPHRRVHVFTDPAGDRYGKRTTCTSKNTLSLAAFPDVEIAVSDLDLDGKISTGAAEGSG
jgi:Uma2 family endonuclease